MSRRNGYLMAASGAALVLASTLWPTSGSGTEELRFWCVLCGSRGAADSLLNILLFVPFGSGLAIVSGPTLAIVGSFLLSGTVEFVQTFLPGRHSDLGDILSNTSGGALGALLTAFRTSIASAVATPSRWVKILAGLVPLTAIAATAALSAPRFFPESDYYGQWTRELGNLPPYPGRVTAALIGELPLPDSRVPNQDGVKEAFRSGEPLLVEAVAGPPPSELSHLFAVYDHQRREVVLLMVQGSDLLFQRGTVSVQLLLDQPFVRWRGVLGVGEGDPIRIAVRQEARNLCIEVDRQRRCDLSWGTAAGWRLVHRLRGAPPGLVFLLSVVWLSLLSLPAGAALGGSARGIPVGLTLGLLGILVSWWCPWLSPHLVDLVGPLPGAWAGWMVRERMARRA